MDLIKIIPCSENWEEFTPTQQGAFCTSCSTEVIDFTDFTNDEIKTYFKAKVGQKICGHYSESQLDPYNLNYSNWVQIDPNILKSKIVLGLMIAFGLNLFSCTSADEKDTILHLNQNLSYQINKDVDVLDTTNKKNDFSVPIIEAEDRIHEMIYSHRELKQYEELSEVIVPNYQGTRVDQVHSGINPYYHEEEKYSITKTCKKGIRLAKYYLSNPDFKARIKSKKSEVKIELKIKKGGYISIDIYDLKDHWIKSVYSGGIEPQNMTLNCSTDQLSKGKKYKIRISSPNRHRFLKFKVK